MKKSQVVVLPVFLQQPATLTFVLEVQYAPVLQVKGEDALPVI